MRFLNVFLIPLIFSTCFADELKPSARLAELKPYNVTDPNLAKLSLDEQRVLYHLILASNDIDAIFREQNHPNNNLWFNTLTTLVSADAQWKPALDYFSIAYGPYDVFHDDWFLPIGIADRNWQALPGKNLYPIVVDGSSGKRQTVSREKLERWLKAHPSDSKDMKNPYSVVRFDSKGDNFVSVPYSMAYRDWLEDAAIHLTEAAAHTKDMKLKELLESRAKAFRTNEYNETESKWIAAHDSKIQFTIGPYEEYMDEIWGAKRGYEARVALKDEKATAELQSYLGLLDAFQKNLPLYEKFSTDSRKSSFITAVNEIYVAGEARSGVQTLAHKLPNDRSLETTIGSRRVLFMNIMKGKCENILKPISVIVMAQDQAKYVSCDSFEKATLHHELAHALGPAFYRDAKGKKYEIGEKLEEMNEPLEEGKADILGMFDRQYMFEKGIEKSEEAEKEMYATFVAGFFRTARFGAGSAHKKGVMLQFNMLKDRGAVTFDPDGRARFNLEKMRKHIRDVVQRVIELQLSGDKKLVSRTLDEYGKIPLEMKKLIDIANSKGIPRDLFPEFPGVKEIVKRVSHE